MTKSATASNYSSNTFQLRCNFAIRALTYALLMSTSSVTLPELLLVLVLLLLLMSTFPKFVFDNKCMRGAGKDGRRPCRSTRLFAGGISEVEQLLLLLLLLLLIVLLLIFLFILLELSLSEAASA